MPQMLDAVLEQVSNTFSMDLQKTVIVKRIESVTLEVWKQTWQPINNRQLPNGNFNWLNINTDFSRKYHKYLISIAIWESDILCGLAFCSRSRGNDTISIHFIESLPDDQQPLKGYIFKITETVCIEYASLKRIKTIRIIEPVNNLVAFYQIFGYVVKKKLLAGSRYLEKEIRI